MAQTQDAIYYNGVQQQMDYTPSGAVAAGDLVAFGTGTKRLVGVANVAIAASAKGSLDIRGFYKVKKKSTVTFEAGETVEWDTGNGQAVDAGDGDGDYAIGVAIEAAASGGDYVITALNLALSEPAEGSS